MHTHTYLRASRALEMTTSTFIKDRSRLILWVGTRKYEICNELLLTNPELDWVAAELSQWLGLPIARE